MFPDFDCLLQLFKNNSLLFQKHSNSFQKLADIDQGASQLMIDRRPSGSIEPCQRRNLMIFLIAEDLFIDEDGGLFSFSDLGVVVQLQLGNIFG